MPPALGALRHAPSSLRRSAPWRLSLPLRPSPRTAPLRLSVARNSSTVTTLKAPRSTSYMRTGNIVLDAQLMQNFCKKNKIGSRTAYQDVQPPTGTEAIGKDNALWMDHAQWNKDGLVAFVRDQVHHFHAHLLRDSCHCDGCVDPSTRQREFASSQIPNDIQIANVERLDDSLAVRWREDIDGFSPEHVSTFSEEDLFNLTNQASLYDPLGVQSLWNKDTFTEHQPWISYDDYLADGDKFRFFMRDLQRFGLAFVKGVPEDEASVANIATRMGPLRNSFYGSTWDVRSVPEAANVAYTNKFLGFHMDLMYMRNPPGYQLLHCMQNSLAGGESMFADALAAAETLRSSFPDLFAILCLHPVRFGYKNKGEHYEMIRPTIELHPPNPGSQIGALSAEHLTKGIIKKINYAPPFQHVAPRYRYNVGFRAYLKAQHAFDALLARPEHIFELKLKPGECVIFENQRVVHARRAFDLSSSTDPNAARWLRGAYVDSDPLQSKFRVLRAQDPLSWNASFPDIKTPITAVPLIETSQPLSRKLLKEVKQKPAGLEQALNRAGSRFQPPASKQGDKVAPGQLKVTKVWGPHTQIRRVNIDSMPTAQERRRIIADQKQQEESKRLRIARVWAVLRNTEGTADASKPQETTL
ncbi:hypothetical protein AJ80_07742 [Polytolypa hystricis UAMH7299]|uniref:TauD/TfdA-like domain-containing protein n=1 Tax=Polytolypa hystricis (strain UAMH7299) TaxID=1447883 RepID=A0A2B7XIW6_POLH7|nr:hypothetical protein AJ80_07742 [Polytolypa hystricis UAMH7299]